MRRLAALLATLALAGCVLLEVRFLPLEVRVAPCSSAAR